MQRISPHNHRVPVCLVDEEAVASFNPSDVSEDPATRFPDAYFVEVEGDSMEEEDTNFK